MKNLKSAFLKPFVSARDKEVRFFGILRESPPLHFYLLQFIGFLYIFYIFSSRNYTVYGLLPDDAFNYPRSFLNEFLPIPLLHFTTFQFLYAVVPRPGPEIIGVLQWMIIGACCFGVLGLGAKWNAIVVFLLGSHLYGMMQSSNADLDSGNLALCLMLILALSPATNFYGLQNGFSLSKRRVDYHWPVALLFIIVGAFFSFSGLSKLIDVGPHWPFALHIENLAERGIEESLFLASRYRNPFIASLLLSPTLSVVAGLVTLISELGFIGILFLPRYRPFLVITMIGMHVLVFMLEGINFGGHILILLLCLDWNIVVRKATVYYDAECAFCLGSMNLVRRFDRYARLAYVPISQLHPGNSKFDLPILKSAMGLEDENGEIYYGADAFEQIASRCPTFYGLAAFMKIPGVIYVARHIYGIIARNRMKYGCRPDVSCDLSSTVERPPEIRS
jgi:predicted DCC family thiol-disulfide oxidoreductase YuxK